MFCEQCGKELPDNARFCSNCGNVIQGNPSQGNSTGVKCVEQKSERKKYISNHDLNSKLKDKTRIKLIRKSFMLGAIAIVVICGIVWGWKSNRADDEREWEGYRADMEAGKWVKEVQCGDYYAQFDLDGNVTTYYKNAYGDDPLAEKLEGTLPLEPEVSMSDSYVEWDVVTYNLIPASADRKAPFSVDGEISYYYDKDNKIRFRDEDGNEEWTYSYSVINDVKLVLTATWRGTVYDMLKRGEETGCNIEKSYSYNADGKMTHFLEVYYFDNGGFRGKEYSIDYDTAGNIVKVFAERTVERSVTRWYYEYTYDAAGHPIGAGLYYVKGMDDSGRLSDEQIREYDEAGNLILETGLNSKSIMTYDEMGNMISRVEYDENGKEKQKDVYTYDEMGNMISRVEYDENGKEKQKDVYTYDKKGNQTCHENYTVYGDKEYIQKKTEYKYDGDGNAKASRETTYKYEANSDYSVVNQINVSKGQWNNGDIWTVTYYTKEEVETYQHNQQFQIL